MKYSSYLAEFISWLVFNIGGLTVLIIGLISFAKTRSKLKKLQSRFGSVSGFAEIELKGKTYYRTIVKYSIDGRNLKFTEEVFTKKPRFQTDQRVRVLYDPRKPEKAEVADNFQLYKVPAILTSVGVLAVVATTLLIWVLRQVE